MPVSHPVKFSSEKELRLKPDFLKPWCLFLCVGALVMGGTDAFAEKSDKVPADWEEAGKVTQPPPMPIPVKDIREKRLAAAEEVQKLSRTVAENARRSQRTAERAAAIAGQKSRDAEKNAAASGTHKMEAGTPVAQ